MLSKLLQPETRLFVPLWMEGDVFLARMITALTILCRYVLLGLPAGASLDVFSHVKWSCESTAESQREQLDKCGLSTKIGEEYDDVDELKDLQALYQRLVRTFWRRSLMHIPLLIEAVLTWVDPTLSSVKCPQTLQFLMENESVYNAL